MGEPHGFHIEDLYVDLKGIIGHELYLKCEGFNFAGSIKVKAAREMIEAAERDGVLRAGSVIVESSSGNLGVALAMIATSKGYRFVCAIDSRCSRGRHQHRWRRPVRPVLTPAPNPPGSSLGGFGDR